MLLLSLLCTIGAVQWWSQQSSPSYSLQSISLIPFPERDSQPLHSEGIMALSAPKRYSQISHSRRLKVSAPVISRLQIDEALGIEGAGAEIGAWIPNSEYSDVDALSYSDTPPPAWRGSLQQPKQKQCMPLTHWTSYQVSLLGASSSFVRNHSNSEQQNSLNIILRSHLLLSHDESREVSKWAPAFVPMCCAILLHRAKNMLWYCIHQFNYELF